MAKNKTNQNTGTVPSKENVPTKGLNIKVKKLVPEATMPKKAHPTDAGFDLIAVSRQIDDRGNIVYGTGLAMEIPKGYAGFLFPRSSNADYDLSLTNCVGVVDSGYRGEIKAKFKPHFTSVVGFNLYHNQDAEYKIGDKFIQIIIMPYPEVEYMEADELSPSDRGKGGYGSTGK